MAASGSGNNDTEIWGEELNLDDDFMQQIETQAISQLQLNCNQQVFISSTKTTEITAAFQHSGVEELQQQQQLRKELEAKQGEVTNLRTEQQSIRNQCKREILKKDEIIADLRKQLCAKQSEIEFQKIEKIAQNCRTPKTSRRNNTFHERFSFHTNKEVDGGGRVEGVSRENKIFNFGRHLNTGDILFKLLNRTFIIDSSSEVLPLPSINFDDSESEENILLMRINGHLVQLCRCVTLHKSITVRADHLIQLVTCTGRRILLMFLKNLGQEEKERNVVARGTCRKSLAAVSRNEYACTPHKHKYKQAEASAAMTEHLSSLLLTNTKWFVKEKGRVARQTITMIAKMLQIQPNLLRTLVDDGRDCNSDGHEKRGTMDLDLILLLHSITEQITNRAATKCWKYEGVLCATLYFCSTLCKYSYAVFKTLGKKHEKCISGILQKILFNLPGYASVYYIVQFLSSTTQYNFSNLLCHKSAAVTSTEGSGGSDGGGDGDDQDYQYYNNRSLRFSEDICMLQALCTYIEVIPKTPPFTDKYTSWIVRTFTRADHTAGMQWLKSQFCCECLPTLEQITIKAVLNCVENYNNERSSLRDRKLVETSVKRCVSILKHFRNFDNDFSVHVTNCKGEYKILLNYMREIRNDESTKKFVTKELEISAEESRQQDHDFHLETRKKLVYSINEFSIVTKADM